MSNINDLTKKIIELAKKAPENRHSYFQLKHFVIGKEPTLQSKMWQCLRELQSRKEALDSLEMSLAEAADQLELLELSPNSEDAKCNETNKRVGEIKERQLARKKRQLQQSILKMQETMTYTLQEAKFFVETFEVLQKIEPLKPYDDLDSQKEYWNERITQQINLKLLLQQPLDTELVFTALSLHEDSSIRIQTEKTLRHIQGQVEDLKKKYVEKMKDKDKGDQCPSE